LSNNQHVEVCWRERRDLEHGDLASAANPPLLATMQIHQRELLLTFECCNSICRIPGRAASCTQGHQRGLRQAMYKLHHLIHGPNNNRKGLAITSLLPADMPFDGNEENMQIQQSSHRTRSGLKYPTSCQWGFRPNTRMLTYQLTLRTSLLSCYRVGRGDNIEYARVSSSFPPLAGLGPVA
jgi:hypothetical protein